jgi:hypothetical protein
VKVSTQKTLSENKRKKTMLIKINDVIEKTLFRSMIIKNLMQKLTIMKKRKRDIMSMKRLLSDDLKLLTSTKKTRERMKKNQTLTFNISSFATIVRRTYVVLTHEMRRKNINVINQQEVINHIIKQNLSLHKEMNIIKIA